MSMPSLTSPRPNRADGQATYGMANLRPQRTGLAFIVFISQRDGAKHPARAKVAPGPKVAVDEMGSYAITPFGFKAGRRLSSLEERQLELNGSVVQDCWDGVIGYAQDALDRVR